MRFLLYLNEQQDVIQDEIIDGLSDDSDIIVNGESEVIGKGDIDDDTEYIDWKGNRINMRLVVSTVYDAIQDIRSNYGKFYNVLLHKSIDIVDSPRFKTMATDGKSIFISPVFVQQLLNKGPEIGPKLVEFVIIHEMTHILFDHTENADPQFNDFKKANAAMDYEINFYIEHFLSEGIDDFPYEGCTEASDGLIDPKFGCMGWKQIYPLVDGRYSSFKKTSDEWKDGFRRGYNKVMGELLKQGKIKLV